MIGYLQHIARYDKLPAKISAKKLDMTDEEKAQRKREQVKQSYLKRKAAGTLKRRPRKSKVSRPRLTELEKEKIRRNIEAFHRNYAKSKEKQIEKMPSQKTITHAVNTTAFLLQKPIKVSLTPEKFFK